jgi:hypothetical protein
MTELFDTPENPYAESDARHEKFSKLAERAMDLMVENARLTTLLQDALGIIDSMNMCHGCLSSPKDKLIVEQVRKEVS